MTFSIVARDPETGAFGVATATGGPCVGALVPHAASGTGAIATQGDTNPNFGFDGLLLLGSGMAADDVVQSVTRADADRQRRQVIAIGPQGVPGMFNGQELEAAAGSLAGTDFAVGGNMLANSDVLAAMAAAFEAQTGLPLHDRLLAAMQAGEAAGGDKRGTQSAALLVYADQPYAALDCRIDLSDAPLAALATLLEVHRSGEYGRFLAARPRRATEQATRA